MKKISVNEAYQIGYNYELSQPKGKNFDPEFKPQLTPAQMLQLGIFGGDYFHVRPDEFPAKWFDGVTLTDKAVAELNYFKVNASQSLNVWQSKWMV